jgi:hypothetical protein
MSKVCRFAMIAALVTVWSASVWAGQIGTTDSPQIVSSVTQAEPPADASADLQEMGKSLLSAETTRLQADKQVAETCIPVYTCTTEYCNWLMFCY